MQECRSFHGHYLSRISNEGAGDNVVLINDHREGVMKVCIRSTYSQHKERISLDQYHSRAD